jgi:hypothetical protein
MELRRDARIIKGTRINRQRGRNRAVSAILVGAIVGRLKGRPKVIYEIGNELRMDKGCTRDDNCRLAEWMNAIKEKILSVDSGALVGSSTGKQGEGAGENEEEIFSTCPNTDEGAEDSGLPHLR